MGYIIELGHETAAEGQESYDSFESVKVKPFNSGSTVALDPDAQKIYDELDISPYEYGDDVLDYDDAEGFLLAVDDEGLVEASINVTRNYSERIKEVTGSHLGNELGRKKAVEAAPFLIELISGLEVEEPSRDYWEPTDGNIGALAAALLDWTFQHPEATFREIV